MRRGWSTSSKYAEPQKRPIAEITTRTPRIVGFQRFGWAGPSMTSAMSRVIISSPAALMVVVVVGGTRDPLSVSQTGSTVRNVEVSRQ